jgi:hypothetical protein
MLAEIKRHWLLYVVTTFAILDSLRLRRRVQWMLEADKRQDAREAETRKLRARIEKTEHDG